MRGMIGAETGGAHAVATHRLSKEYRGVSVLDTVSLSVPEGGVYVLMGANGAGKSTLLKVLLNLEPASGGRAEVFGLDVGRRGPDVRAQVGYVPEHHDIGYGWLTCGALLRHVAAYYPAWDRGYADQLGGELGLGSERKVGTLSKGESRRLQLVMALAHRPPLLLLDEVTDGLDPVVRKRLLELLVEHLSDSPTTVLLSTHQIHDVESLADHVGVLREGRLVAQMPRDQLQRTVRRYHLEVPPGWEAPRELRVLSGRRSSAGRAMQWTLVGEEREVTERLRVTGAEVREVVSLPLEDAALAFLTVEAPT